MAHFLLIDDDPDFVDALAAELRREGNRVTCVADCNAGLDAVALEAIDDPIDAVLVDIFMPEADGFETIRALRRAGVTAPVIAITAGGSKRFSGVLEWATALGANGSLTKPFQTDRLMQLLEAMSDDTERLH